MKRIKKLMALLLAAIMVVGMTTAVFATGTGDPTSPTTNTAEATVSGVEAEDGKEIKVWAYQIIKLNANNEYEEVIENSIEKDKEGNLAPTPENIQELALRLSELEDGKTELKKQTDGTYTGKLEAGSYLIIVEGSEKYIYNPAILSVNETTTGLVGGTLNVTAPWNGTTYVKKNIPTIDKKATGVEGEDNVQGVQYGDIIKFEITTDVPRYATSKKNIIYKISDELLGLSLVNDNTHLPTAKVGMEDEWVEDDSTLNNAVSTAIVDGAKNFTVILGSDTVNNNLWILNHGGQKIVITYYAKVTSDAKLTVDELTNTAKLEYSTYDKTGTTSDDTKHYTFGIDTQVTGKEAEGHTSGEFIKVDETGKAQYTEGNTKVEVIEGKPLEGAEFQLHIGSEKGPLFSDKTGKDTFTTTSDGRLEILGLDDNVEYWLVETNPPTGYTLNNNPVKVNIEAQYDSNGILEGYQVYIGGQFTADYKWNGTTSTINGSPENPMNPYNFKNTKLTELPSTGGMGTTIFTIAGCAIMIAAVGLFFASRKKQNK